jgi:2-polyprenyl-6-methoxyphenol hydroxylase-like FAD-dependent oxidoreductase
MEKTVLIAGAGIAGLTMAFWLNRNGYKVTVVEISSGLKKGGAAIDVRGDALIIADRMGILDKIKSSKIKTEVEFVDANDKTIVAMPNFGQAGQDVELYRDHLAEIIYEAAAISVEYVFGNRIKSVIQDDMKAIVIFEDNQKREFDLIIGADGVHSSVRKLIFGEVSRYNEFFGAYFAILKEDESLGKLNQGRIFSLPGKMAATSEGGNSMLIFRSQKLNYDHRNDAEYKEILGKNFTGDGWKIPDILKAMIRSEYLYFDEVCQIKMLSWTKGRVALIGDAAHCSGFPTGMGTSLAMQGATLLADELVSAGDDYISAFARYNEVFHPIVETVQATISGGLNFLVPDTEEGIRLRNEMIG